MRAASLFSGIGAPEQAMPGWTWLWHAEVEAFPSAVMRIRHPGSPNLGDVNAGDFVERALRFGRPDVLVFGSPCQDFSVAGGRVGLDGARGNLALVALRVARELGVRWLAFENVPGLLHSYSGSAEAQRQLEDRIGAGPVRPADARIDCVEDSDFAAFLSAVRKCGHLGCYRVFDARFAGVPQRRRRVFFVGHRGDWRPAAAVLFEPESLDGAAAPDRPADEGAIPAGAAGGAAGDRRTIYIPDVAATLVAGGNNTGGNRYPGLTPDTAAGGLIAFDCKANGVAGFGLSGTTFGTMRGDGNGGGHLAVADGHMVRRLTPRECERLQAMPDDYTLVPWRGGLAGDGVRYNAIGNSMCVNDVRAVLSRIEAFDGRAGA